MKSTTATATVLASVEDAAALTEWAADTGAPLAIHPVDDWAKPPRPRDLPAGDVHVFAATRESKEAWEAVRDLCNALALAGRLPRLIETTMPLDMTLAPETSWETLAGQAVAKPKGRAPAAETARAARTKGEFKCLTSIGVTVRESEDGLPDEPVLPWAAREVEVLKKGTTTVLSLEVSFQTEDGPVERVLIPHVDANTLESFAWLEFDVVARKLPRPSPTIRTDVANAIRCAEGPNGEQTESRVGYGELRWIEDMGRPMYVKTDGGMGSDGVDRGVFALNPASESASRYSWGDDLTIDEERAALRAVLVDMPGMMKTPDAFYAVLGQVGRAMNPGASRCPLLFWGTQNNGKTVMGRTSAGFMGAGMLEGRLPNFKATPVALEMISRQFATGICLVDDIPPVIDPTELRNVRDVLDELLRLGHPEGGAKERGTVAGGEVGLKDTVEVHPTVTITTEESLLMLMPRASLRNRGLAVEIVRGQEFESADASDEFEEMAKRVVPSASYALTRWVAGQIEAAGGLAVYERGMQKALRTLTAEARAEFPGSDTRVHQVAAGFTFGVAQFAGAALALGALTEAECRTFVTAASAAITRLMRKHIVQWLSQVEGTQILLEIHTQVRAGRAIAHEACMHGVTMGGFCKEGHGTVRSIAKRVTLSKDDKDAPDGGQFVALVPEDVADLLSKPGSPRTREQVRKQLLEIEGTFERRLRVGGGRAYCVLMPVEAFEPGAAADDNSAVLSGASDERTEGDEF